MWTVSAAIRAVGRFSSTAFAYGDSNECRGIHLGDIEHARKQLCKKWSSVRKKAVRQVQLLSIFSQQPSRCFVKPISRQTWVDMKLRAVENFEEIKETGIQMKVLKPSPLGARVAEGQTVAISFKAMQGPDWGVIERWNFLTLRLGDFQATSRIPIGVHELLRDMRVGERRIALLSKRWFGDLYGVDRDFVYIDVQVFSASENCSPWTDRCLGKGIVDRIKIFSGWNDLSQIYARWRQERYTRNVPPLDFKEQDFNIRPATTAAEFFDDSTERSVADRSDLAR